MSERDELAQRVAERLGFEIRGAERYRADGHPFCIGSSADERSLWDALLSAEQRVEELEEALRRIVRCPSYTNGGQISDALFKAICEAEAALSPKAKESVK